MRRWAPPTGFRARATRPYDVVDPGAAPTGNPEPETRNPKPTTARRASAVLGFQRPGHQALHSVPGGFAFVKEPVHLGDDRQVHAVTLAQFFRRLAGADPFGNESSVRKDLFQTLALTKSHADRAGVRRMAVV